MTLIAVVMVTWNGRDHLERCLASLGPQIDRQPVEVVVVDNGSTDGTAELVARRFPWVRLVEAGANLGFAEGTNRGIDASDAPWVFTLNNDCVVTEGAIAALVEAARGAPPELGMLQPCLVFSGRPDHVNSTGVRLRRNGSAVDRDFDRRLADAAPAGEVFCATAGAALYRRAMLEAVRLESGYFDRDFFLYMEDVDLGWRCRLAGFRAEYLPHAVVRHEFQGSSSRQGSRFVEVQCRKNRLRMLVKNASLPFLLTTAPRTLTDAVRLLAWVGPGVVPRALRALGPALAGRREVARLLRQGRREVERAWVR